MNPYYFFLIIFIIVNGLNVWILGHYYKMDYFQQLAISLTGALIFCLGFFGGINGWEMVER